MQPAALILALFAAAAPAKIADSPTAALRARDAEIRAALPPPGTETTPAVREKLEKILIRAIDIEAMAKVALGERWGAQSRPKRQEFLDAFLQAFRNGIRGQLDFYRSAKTEFGIEKPENDHVMVPTTLTVKGEPTEVRYAMKKEGGEWRIVDIVVDDVSTVENYRASFGKIIAKEGFDGLIARLKKRPET